MNLEGINETLPEEKDEKTNEKKKIGWSRFSITIEPVLLVIPFIGQFTSGITIDLLQENVCHQKFNLSYSNCTELKSLPSDIRSDIAAKTADINMINNLIQAVFPIILVLLIGPWSDTNGRKPFLQWGIRGFMVFYYLWGVMSFFPKIPVICFIIPALPLSLSGGWISIIVACQSFTADNWEEKKRAFRISIIVFFGVVGNLLGNVLSPIVFHACGNAAYPVMYLSSAGLASLLHVYVTFFVQETIINKGSQTRLIDLKHIKSIFTVLIRNPIKGRFKTILTMMILTSEITSSVGESNLCYFIGKVSFNWKLVDYNMFSSVTTIISTICPVAGTWLLKSKLKLHSYSVILFCSCHMFMLNMLKSFSTSEQMFWIVSCIHRVFSITGPCIDLELSLLVSENNIGKAFAFSSLLDALSPLVSLPLFNEIYKAMLPDRTLRMYLLTSAFSFITVISSTLLSCHRCISTKNSSKEDYEFQTVSGDLNTK